MLCKACFRPYLHVFHPIRVLAARGGGGGSPKGLVHNLLMQSFTLDSSKIEVFKICFFDIVATQYDHPSYLKHVLGRIYMFFTLFAYWVGGGGGSQGNGAQPAGVSTDQCAPVHIHVNLHPTAGVVVLGARRSVSRPQDRGHVIGHAWPW